jgi:hypothetical protein
MSPKVQKIYNFIYPFEKAIFLNKKRPKGGRKKTYSHTSFILFFIAMFLQGIDYDKSKPLPCGCKGGNCHFK